MPRGLIGTKRLLERAGAKAPTAGTVYTGQADFGDARLSPQQVDRFIDYVIDETVMFKDGLRVLRMNADRQELNKLGMGTRALRRAAEAEVPGLTAVTHAKRSLTTVECILAVDISFSYLEDNVERAGAEDHIAQIMARQLANDIEDLAINGDEGSMDPFLSINDGWIDILKTAADNVFDTNGSTDYRNVVFKGMLDAMPNKFRQNKAALRFYVSVSVEEDYRFQVGQRQTAGGDVALAGSPRMTYAGIPVVAVSFMADSDLLLTMPDNLAVGIQRNISLGQFRNERKRVQEYTWTLRNDYEVVETDAAVIAYDA